MSGLTQLEKDIALHYFNREDENTLIRMRSEEEIKIDIEKEYYPPKRVSREIRRNSLCPCGSGKKAKNCCGAGKEYK